ncbi:MAG: 2-octaprenyl-3-methyl-6-methoxy-1,4-benzoquinol hydroxylase [Rheinheimera sp.]|nr:MAG: 2-octaprenyl-3-methyl-6-methoxy-1,4-benzoquinol hydroxylase [Rheinheimera sp.]
MFDIAIVGGGMVGAALAVATAQAGIKVALLERQTPGVLTDNCDFDLRVSAINRRSEAWLQQLGAWQQLSVKRLAPYATLKAFEGDAAPLDFTAAELGESHLGHIIENLHIQQALWQQLPDTVQQFCPVQLSGYQQFEDHACLQTDQGEIKARLLIAADGAQSQLKQLAGIGSQGWQYKQACLLVHVKTSYDALSMTWQQFTPQGPRAYLPLPGKQASLVWYDDHLRIQQLAALPSQQLEQQIKQHFPAALREFSVVKQGYFQLTRSHANQYVKGRLVLVGDAAHTINPLAGQGVNLGFADAECLSALLIKQFTAGADLAAPALLAQYERERRKANLLMMSAMDVFYQVFSSKLKPLAQLRRLGLQVAAKAGPLKTYVGKYAAGLV